MKLKSLRLRNFRSHLDTTLQLDRLNIIRGLNGAGKTSVAYAIELLLTGRCPVTDQAGRGTEALIRYGASELQVEAELEHESSSIRFSGVKAKLARSRGGATMMIEAGQPFVGTHAHAWIKANIADREVLTAVLNAGAFLELSAKDQAALLATVLAPAPVTLTGLPEGYGLPSTTTVDSVAAIDYWYKRFFEMRTETNRELRQLETLKPPEWPKEMPDRATVTAQLEKLQAELRDHQERWRVESSKYAEHKLRYEAACAQRDSTPALSAPAIDELEEAVRGTEAWDSAYREIGGVAGELQTLEATIAQLQKLDSECPTCQRPLPAATKAKTIKKLEDIRERANGLHRTLKQKLSGVDPHVAAAKLAQNQVDLARIKAANEALVALGGPGAPPAAPGAIAELTARINKGQEVLAAVARLEGQTEACRAQKERREQLTKRALDLELLLETFGPTTKAQLVAGKLDAFTANLNTHMAGFGFQVGFSLEPYEFRVILSGAEDTPLLALRLDQLSESERFRFAVALQVALAMVTEVRLVIIDRADVLTAENRQLLAAMLEGSGLEQAIILGSSDQPDAPIDLPPGVSFTHLHNDGTTTMTHQHQFHEEKQLTYEQSE
jgi:hypothetical protein